MNAVFVCHKNSDKKAVTPLLAELLRNNIPLIIGQPGDIIWPQDLMEKALHSEDHVMGLGTGDWDETAMKMLDSSDVVACLVALYTEAFRDAAKFESNWNEVAYYDRKAQMDGRPRPLLLKSQPINGGLVQPTLRELHGLSVTPFDNSYFDSENWVRLLATQIQNYYHSALGVRKAISPVEFQKNQAVIHAAGFVERRVKQQADYPARLFRYVPDGKSGYYLAKSSYVDLESGKTHFSRPDLPVLFNLFSPNISLPNVDEVMNAYTGAARDGLSPFGLDARATNEAIWASDGKSLVATNILGSVSYNNTALLVLKYG